MNKLLERLARLWLFTGTRIDALWGYDVFIAHRRADAAQYAATLYAKLKEESISCFIDAAVYGPGDSLLVATRRHVAKSSLFFLVGSPQLVVPRTPVDWVGAEIQVFLSTHPSDPKVLLVEFGKVVTDALASSGNPRPTFAPFLKDLASFLRVSEPAQALFEPPSEAILSAIRTNLRGRRRDRTRLRFFQATALVLAALLAVAVILGVLAIEQREKVFAQAYAATAYAYSDRDPTYALSLAQAALRIAPNTAAELAVLKAFNLGSWLYSARIDDAQDAVLSPDGSKLAWIDHNSILHLRDVKTLSEESWRVDTGDVEVSLVGNMAISSTNEVIVWGYRSHLGHLTVWDANGKLLKTFTGNFLTPFQCGGDTLVLADYSHPNYMEFNSQHVNLRLRIIDLLSRSERSIHLRTISSSGFGGACSPHARTIALAGANGIVVVNGDTGAARTYALPSNYGSGGLAVSRNSKYLAVYLRAGIIGLKDALEIIDLSGAKATPPKVIPLMKSPGSDTSGIVAFIDNNRVVAASTSGWSAIVSAKTYTVKPLPVAQRAAEEVAVDRNTGEFAIARRSGVVTIFDKEGFPIAQLVGNSSSDSLNSDFRRMTFDSTGRTILTVAQDGMRLWTRPKEPLLRAVKGMGDDAPIKSFKDTFGGGRGVKPCQNRNRTTSEDLVIDNSGSLALCVELNGRQELLFTGLTNEEFEPVAVTRIESGTSVATMYTEDPDYVRLFALDPDRVLAYLKRRNDFWRPTRGEMARLIK